jgi:hypothetical protein
VHAVSPVFLDDTLDWRTFDIPRADRPVRIVRLHRDESEASTLAVRFPAGWTRASSGSYASAEEFVVLEGALEMNGERYSEGTWVFVEARARRFETRVARDTLCVARWSGPAAWRDAEGVEMPIDGISVRDVTFDTTIGGLDARVLRRSADGTSFVAPAGAAGVAAATDMEIVDLSSAAWYRVGAGVPLPGSDGPRVCRTFSQSEGERTP